MKKILLPILLGALLPALGSDYLADKLTLSNAIFSVVDGHKGDALTADSADLALGLYRDSSYNVVSTSAINRERGVYSPRGTLVWRKSLSVGKADYIISGTAYYDANIPTKTGLYSSTNQTINLYNALPSDGYDTLVTKFSIHLYNFSGGVVSNLLYVGIPTTQRFYSVPLTNSQVTDFWVTNRIGDLTRPMQINCGLFGSTGFANNTNAIVLTSIECFGYYGGASKEPVLNDNGLAQTPPMGWTEWNAFHGVYNEATITNAADRMVTNGMLSAGYNIIMPDVNMWQSNRDGSGYLVEVSNVFPSGLTWLGNALHAKGFKFGIYASATTNGGWSIYNNAHCIGNEARDVETFAAVGADYLKYDRFGGTSDEHSDRQAMAKALYSCSRPITYAVSMNNMESYKPFMAHVCRVYSDISATWASVSNSYNWAARYADYTRPGFWVDPDMLEVGNGSFTDAENQSHFAMWCILAAPLWASMNLTNITAATLQTINNASLIAINQDAAGNGGYLVEQNGFADGVTEVWGKRLANGDVAAVLLNSSGTTRTVTADWTNLWLTAGSRIVTNCITQKSVGEMARYSVPLASHASAVIRIKGPSLAPQRLTETPWTTKSGTITKDMFTGNYPARIAENWYPNSMQLFTPSDVVFNLTGLNAERFTADIGVDDGYGNASGTSVEIYADAAKLWSSGTITKGTKTNINLSLAGYRTLRLVSTNATASVTNYAQLGRPIIWRAQ